MTGLRAARAPSLSNRSRSTSSAGGVGYLVAAVLQLLADARVVLPSVPEWITPGWQLLGWLLGGLVLLGASVLLAVGRRGEAGIVGPRRWFRAALAASGTGPLLLVLVSVLTFATGGSGRVGTIVALGTGQLLICIASVVTAVAVIRGDALTGAAQWAFLAPAVVDAVAVVLVLSSSGIIVFSVFVVVVRPVAVAAVGATLVAQRLVQRPERSGAGAMATKRGHGPSL